MMTKRGVCFIHIQTYSGVRFAFVTRHNCFPSVCLELLGQLASLVEQYCGIGTLSEEGIRSNLTLIYELFDEVRKRSFKAMLYIRMIILPRQARDKHRENSKTDRFLAGDRLRVASDHSRSDVGELYLRADA
jgi:hypothetical protein